MKKKLYIVTRDGKAVHDFVDAHGMTKDDVIVVKKASDIDKTLGLDKYVIILPLPFSYQSIKPLLVDMVNMTRYYKNLLNKF